MGELDENPFVAAAKRKYSKEEAEEKGMELCSLWEEYLRDPSWHPYKVIVDGENAKVSVNFINLYQQHMLFVFVHGEFCDRHAHAWFEKLMMYLARAHLRLAIDFICFPNLDCSTSLVLLFLSIAIESSRLSRAIHLVLFVRAREQFSSFHWWIFRVHLNWI